MKRLNDFLYESLLDDEKTLVNKDDSIIDEFLNKNYEIYGKYTIHDGIVDVDGAILVTNKNIKSLTNGLFKFGRVQNEFVCANCKNLTSLDGAPEDVGLMECQKCNLTSLDGAPKIVGDIFNCSFNPLKSLKNGPKTVEGEYICASTNIVDLKGAPEKVIGDFNCSGNLQLKNLEGSPKYVGGNFQCEDCENLISTKGCPEEIGGNFDLSECRNLSDFNNLPKKIKGLFMTSIKVDKKDIKQKTKARRVIIQ